MATGVFYKYFSVISIGTAILLFVLCQIELFKPYLMFSYMSLGLFMLLTLIIFLFGEKAATSSNKSLFTALVLGITFGKIFLSLFFVIGYHQIVHPSSKLFLLPFFIVYLIFTIFETYLLMKISQNNKPTTKVA